MILGDDFESETSKDDDNDDSHRDDDTSAEAQDESESFSDIDDKEVINKWNILSVRGLSKYTSSFRAENDCYIVLAKLFSDFEHGLIDRRQIDTIFFLLSLQVTFWTWSFWTWSFC